MKNFVLTLCLCIPFTFLWSQNDDESKNIGFLNGNLQFGIPMDEFRDNLDNLGIGGGGILLFKLGESPVYAGLELSGMLMDRETTDYTVNIGGFFEDYELRTSNSIFLGHAVLRFAPDVGDFPIKPYIDGMIGFKNLYTRTRLIDLDDTQDNGDDSRVDSGDWAFSYGGAAGLQLAIFGNEGITLDLRCAYLPGTNAEYLVRRADDAGVIYEEPIDAFEKRSSITTLLMPQIGLTFNLDNSIGDEIDDDF